MTKKNNQYLSEEQTRQIKLEEINAQKVNAYPSLSKRSHLIEEALIDFSELSKKKSKLTLVGRVKSIRRHGGSSFVHLEDGTDTIQLFIRKNIIGSNQYEFFKQYLDVADFIQVSGILFLTKMGEKTLEVKEFNMLSKALLPLPEKWHGLTDVEIRYRQRYLDLIANAEVRLIFQKRAMIIDAIREFLNEHEFLEVETPVLQSLAGGATAKPFVTHHNVLDQDMYLRIAPELYLKRLVIGGFEKVYEIARCFRNEGIDRSHNPEFTQVEFYYAYQDYQGLMKFTEQLLTHVIRKVQHNFMVKYKNHHIDFTPPYPRVTFRQALIKEAGIDIEKYPDRDSLAKEAKNKGLKIDKAMGRGKIIDELYKELARPKMIQPTFLIDHPIELSPLAKKKERDPRYTERFQLIVAGDFELCNAFSELNDPLDQEERFKDQEKLKRAGDEEAQPYDKDFIQALKHGMPPCAGLGMGIDRLVSLLTNTSNLKEVILFPTLKQK